MKSHPSLNRLVIFLPLVIAVAFLVGCAARQEAAVTPADSTHPAEAAESEPTVVLAYSSPDDRALKYRLTVDQHHSMQMMGRYQDFDFSKELEFSLERGEEDQPGQGLKLKVTVDHLQLKLEAPRDMSASEISKIVGKSFYMSISPAGEESDFLMTQAVDYEMQPAGKMNVSTDLETFFPDFTDEPVKIGSNWLSTSRGADTAFNSGKVLVLETAYKLIGFETIGDRECVRIQAQMRGHLEEGGLQDTSTPDMTAVFDGSGIWHFDHQNGVLLRSQITLNGRGEMETGGGKGPPAGISQRMTITARLVE